MATAGWYPDPSGRPGAFRYWDGEVWSQGVADSPYGPPPPGHLPPAPTPPPAPPAPPGTASGYQSYAAIGPLGPPDSYRRDDGPAPVSAQTSGTGGRGRAALLVLVAALATLLLGVGTFFVVDAMTDEDTSARQTTPDPTTPPAPEPEPEPAPTEPTQPPEQPTEPPSDQPTEPPARPTVEQCTSGLPGEGVTGPQRRFMTGGGLRLPTPDGFEPSLDQSEAFTFADGVYAPARVIEQGITSGWVAVYALGSVEVGDGFGSPREAAETVVGCMTSSSTFYDSLTGTTELDSAETTVDGNPAWELTQEVRVDNPELSVEGDIAKVVVVDTGDPASYGLFVSVVPIGDEQLVAEQDAAVDRLRVR